MVTTIHDRRLGLAPGERSYVTVRFVEGIDAQLQDELRELVGARGARGLRVAERLAPVELVIQGGERRIIGRSGPPTVRFGRLEKLDFRLREQGRVAG